MTCVTMQSREVMSLSVKNTALWALKVPLDEVVDLTTACQCSEHTSDVSLGKQITTGATSQNGGYMRNSQ